jgi:hypothetical protein
MKVYGGVDVYIHVFLISALVGGEWSASYPGRFTPRTPSIDWIGGRVGPRVGPDDMKRRKKFFPYRDLNSHPSTVQPVANHYFDCNISVQVWQNVAIRGLSSIRSTEYFRIDHT